MSQMYEPLENLDGLLAGVLLLLWATAGWRAGRLAARVTAGRLRRAARWDLALLGVGTLVAAAKLTVVGLIWRVGWEFADGRVLVGAPVLLAPLAVVAVLSLPRLWSVAQPAAPAPAADRAAAADPHLVVPIQVMAVGALVGVYLGFVSRPVPPYAGDAVTHGAPLATAAALLWWRQARRQRALGHPASTPPRRGTRALRVVGALAAVLATLAGVYATGGWASRLPGRISMASHEHVDHGGQAAAHHGGHGQRTVSVTDLTGPRTGIPDREFTLTAQPATVRLTSGETVRAWTYNGQVPGPELRVRQGDLVQVTLVNRLPGESVTIHWHGVNVPNAEDGVAGVTQNAVRPGERHTYRFRAEQAGTFWYHTHQRPLVGIRRGLFGALVVLPAGGEDTHATEDITVMAHNWETARGTRVAFGTADTLQRRAIAPGTRVRLRLINTDQSTRSDTEPKDFTLVGVPFQVAAIDGTDVNQPTDLHAARLLLAEGGRYDLTFTMPDGPVRLADYGSPAAGLLLSPDGTGDAPPLPEDTSVFDPASYGTPAPTPFGPASRFDREFRVLLDDRVGFFDGRLHLLPVINGHSFPDIPAQLVREGDLVKVTLINRSHQNHPMHPHGHHVLVLSRNGRAVRGSPWWTDTFDIKPGETFEVAFRADNPGVWMDHCHDLGHAANGMVLHLAYEGVTSPFQIGRDTVNQPE